MIKIECSCSSCGGTKILDVDEEMLIAWSERKILAQRAFPHLSVDDRELLISGTCGTCFDEMFKEE